jgi:hypothetical protein
LANPKQLTRAEILRAAKNFSWMRKMPKWTVVVEGRELPARPLVLEAARVPPNDPTNSHQAVAILEGLGFETRYVGGRGTGNVGVDEETSEQPTDFEGLLKMVEGITASVPDEAWAKMPADFSENVDHYLYGTHKKKND